MQLRCQFIVIFDWFKPGQGMSVTCQCPVPEWAYSAPRHFCLSWTLPNCQNLKGGRKRERCTTLLIKRKSKNEWKLLQGWHLPINLPSRERLSTCSWHSYQLTRDGLFFALLIRLLFNCSCLFILVTFQLCFDLSYWLVKICLPKFESWKDFYEVKRKNETP